jgi:hypothetical protein
MGDVQHKENCKYDYVCTTHDNPPYCPATENDALRSCEKPLRSCEKPRNKVSGEFRIPVLKRQPLAVLKRATLCSRVI